MVPERVSSTHQLSRAKSVLLGLKNLPQREVSRNRISVARQHDRHCLHQQQRGYTFPPTYDSGLRDVGLVSAKRHPCDSFSHSRKRQRLCRQGVQRIQGHERVEAFTINWAPLRGYCFPPFNLISPTLTKATNDQTDLILVAPVWQAQPWWPVLLRLLISQPVLLPNIPTLLTDPSDLNRVHPMYPRLHLAVFHISTNTSKVRAFHQTLPIFSSQQLVPPHTKPSLVGTVGAAGVLDGRLILFRHL